MDDNGGAYFEAQNSRDCVLHSLNNAFGRRVVDKRLVLRHIEETVARRLAEERASGASPSELRTLERELRERFSSGGTFFAADIVWDAAQRYGAFGQYGRVPGVATPALDLKGVLKGPVGRLPIVVLGGDNRGGTHAIAVRGGRIYDSERTKEGPVPLSREQLLRSLPRVFGAYAFFPPGTDAPAALRGVELETSGFGSSGADDDDPERKRHSE